MNKAILKYLCGSHGSLDMWNGNKLGICFSKVVILSIIPILTLLLCMLWSGISTALRFKRLLKQKQSRLIINHLNNRDDGNDDDDADEEYPQTVQQKVTKHQNVFTLSIVNTLLTLVQVVLSLIQLVWLIQSIQLSSSSSSSTTATTQESNHTLFASCCSLGLWAFCFFLYALSSMGKINRPLVISLYPVYFINSIAILLTLQHAPNKPMSVTELAIGLVLVITEIGQRYISSYIEPLPCTDGRKRPITLEHNASFLSRAMFHWLTPMVMVGKKRPLEDEDLWRLRDIDNCQTVVQDFNATKAKSSNLYMRLLRVVGGKLAFQVTCGFATAILSFAGPFFLNRILVYIQCPDDSFVGPWGFLIALFVCSMAKAVNDGQMYFTGRRIGIHIRAILVSEIYTKSLRRALTAGSAITPTAECDVQDVTDGTNDQGEGETDPLLKKKEPKDTDSTTTTDTTAKMQASQGRIVTLMSVDTESLRTFVSYLHEDIIRLPLSVILTFVGLFALMRWAAFAGLGTLIILAPATTWLSKKANDIQTELMSATDDRVNVTNEVLQGIRIIKYFSWEPQFVDRIEKFRAIELKKYVHNWLVYAGFGLLSYGGGVIISFTTFAAFTLLQGETLDPATAFTALSLLHRLSRELGMIPQEFTHILQMKVSMDRIIDFLKETELDRFNSNQSTDNNNGAGKSETAVGFRNGKFVYHGSVVGSESSGNEQPDLSDITASPTFTLHDLHVEFPLGKLTVICGSTGAGKSSLILSLLGELHRVNGETHLPDPRVHAMDKPNPNTGLVSNSVSYVAQTAWMLNATVRDNILFGRPFDADRYWKVIEACALTRDLETLDAGDMTEIGEKGVNVSGGQKQRISLARAAYSPASIVLLDDPLSAVDAPTARHLLYKCILGPIMKGRTVILVSHAVGLTLPKAYHVVVMRNGTITSQGTPASLLDGDHLQGIISDEVLAKGAVAFFEEASEVGSDVQSVKDEAEASSPSKPKPDSTQAIDSTRKDAGRLVKDEEKAVGSVRGEVYWSYIKAAGGIRFLILIIVTYFMMFGSDIAFSWWLMKWSDASRAASGGEATCPSMPVSHNTTRDIASPALFYIDKSYEQSVQVGFSPFLTTLLSLPGDSVEDIKTNDNSEDSVKYYEPMYQIGSTKRKPKYTPPSSDDDDNNNDGDGKKDGDDDKGKVDVMFYIKFYAMFGFLVMLSNNINLGVQLFHGIKAARNLHSKLLNTVLGAPMRFFETTPLGRILNRFSKDIRGTDMEVMACLGWFMQCVFQIVNILAIVTFAQPLFLVFVAPTLVLYYYVATAYLNTSRELKRLEAVSRSPVYGQFSETLTGASTIRAYGHEDRFVKQAEQRIDQNHRAFFYLWVSNRWLCLRTDMISACVVFIAGFAVLYGEMPAAWAGLTLSYSLEFTEALLWVVRSHAEMEMNMNSVERVQEYSNIDQEPPAVIEGSRPPAVWPINGIVKVRNLSIKYAPELPKVLKSLDFDTVKFEKIGVVGRTGAGKSTLSLAFFRILPFAEGSITIDGVDISKIGLRDLRSRLTIIPQDPVLFSGTLRSNLDPVDEHDDASIWQALKRVHFLDSLQEMQDTATLNEDSVSVRSFNSSRSSSSRIPLEAPVTENGNNFSQGQRQLLCLARALLRRSKFIILDEATASVDNATDAAIQETIREEFKDSTLLCIAHRLRTVVDYDRILVLDTGSVAEFDTPYNLIQKKTKGGIFRGMCEESGEFDELLEIAKAKHDKKMGLVV